MSATRSEPEDTDGRSGRKPPWADKAIRSPQAEGRFKEKAILKRHGARTHPNSGAGSIKHDGSTEDFLIEVKTTESKSYSLTAKYCEMLRRRAVQQGKEAKLIVEFPGGLEADIIIRKV